ncbi:MAG TPA: type VII secretion target [Candidatus Limiplasma sp.]|nr:type VII secretion target [Candidatus Limiplasma sp.]
MNYNSGEVRRAARKAQSVASDVSSVWNGSLKSIASSVTDSLSGNTAQTLQSAVNSLGSDITKVAVQLDNIASDLFAYAKYLDWLDEQAKKEIDRQ